jgi:pimeloyl-ACP methyl ester carboxylesterase
MLGGNLDEMGGWPDAGSALRGTSALAGGHQFGLCSAGVRRCHARSLPRVQLVKIKDAGHWVHSEQPEVFLATIRRFLGL